MDNDAELTRMAIEEIIRDKPSGRQERKVNPLRRLLNKRFLRRTLTSINAHNKRKDKRNKERCRQKLRELGYKSKRRHERRKDSVTRKRRKKYAQSDIVQSVSSEECEYNQSKEGNKRKTHNYAYCSANSHRSSKSRKRTIVERNGKEYYNDTKPEETYFEANITGNHIYSLQNHPSNLHCATNENINVFTHTSLRMSNTSADIDSISLTSNSSRLSITLEDSDSSVTSRKYCKSISPRKRYPSIDLCSNTSTEEDESNLSALIIVNSETDSEDSSQHTSVSAVSILSSLSGETNENSLSNNSICTENQNITIDLT